MAYDQAARAIRGSHAKCNFPLPEEEEQLAYAQPQSRQPRGGQATSGSRYSARGAPSPTADHEDKEVPSIAFLNSAGHTSEEPLIHNPLAAAIHKPSTGGALYMSEAMYIPVADAEEAKDIVDVDGVLWERDDREPTGLTPSGGGWTGGAEWMSVGRSVDMGAAKFLIAKGDEFPEMGSIRHTLEIPADFADEEDIDDDLDDDVMILGTTPQFGSTPRHPHSVLGQNQRSSRVPTRMGVRTTTVEVLVEAEETDEFDSSSDDDLMLGMSPDVQGHGWEGYRAEVTHATGRGR